MQEDPKPPLLKKDVIAVFNNNASALARFLRISRAAVDKWPEEVPLLRQYQLRERLPAIDNLVAAVRKSRAPRKRRNRRKSDPE